MAEPLEVPKCCMECPGFILTVEPGKSWLTSEGEVTTVFSERGVWETLEEAEKARESFFV